MAARGAFDPKLQLTLTKKQFKDTEYYSILNSTRFQLGMESK
jgi:hypothetical protein